MGISEIIGVALLLACLVIGWLAVRRLRLIRIGGVDVALRRVRASAPGSTRGWNLGVGRYRGDEFVWYRVISLGAGANVVLSRLDLEIVDRRRPGSTEEYVVPADSTVLRCRDGERIVELAMTPGVLTGFLSWLEAAPPGRFGGYRKAS
ncbi:MAG TPA: DUF2550 domain-containing protein [Pseudonocardia sp.]|jgi:hypothetical protein|uniref:DUF2550 domain-containing protein n=1 Tax=Pseudonocardia sp. TaxID=60912 RepID=UPI002BA31B67|nr:DUF2550 domain-containing protein [Pseudonocardia sp.]HTF48608.1 DUF2550 domain-containing protein [Pseudonocardia sp.]